MTVVRTNAIAATFQELRDGVRRCAGDLDRTRFDNPDVDWALNHAMAEVHREMGLEPSQVLSTSDVSYTSGADSIALNDTMAIASIYRAENVSQSTPVPMTYVAPQDIERYRRVHDDFLDAEGERRWLYRWSIQGTNLYIRPRGAVTVRLHFMQTPWVVAGDDDQHPYPVELQEFIEQAAALRLLEIDDQVPLARMNRLSQLRNDMVRYARRFRGPRKIRRIRPFRF